MKKSIFIFCMLLGLINFTACHINDTEGNDKQSASSTELFICPMHPEISSAKPGSCPKCGMDLEKVEPDKKSDSSSVIDSKNTDLNSDSIKK